MKSFLILLLLLPAFLRAQSIDPNLKTFQTWLNQEPSLIHKYTGSQLPKNEEQVVAAAQTFVSTHYTQLLDARSSLQFASYRKSPMGYHMAFNQTFHGQRIYATEVKVNVTPDFKILSIMAKLVETSSWNLTSNNNSFKPESGQEKVLIYNGISPEYGICYQTYNERNKTHVEVLQGESGFVFTQDLGRYLKQRNQGPDSLAFVYVFYPDPIQSEEVSYGGAFKNNKGRDTLDLTKARVIKPIEMQYLSDSFWAENQWVKIIGNNKNFVSANSRTDSFDFKRANPFFDQINALYHISNFHHHLDSLGFKDLAKYQIEVNTAAFTTDQSRFNRIKNNGGKGNLEYGYSVPGTDSHVDDAEDADVVIHEFGHAISYHANQNELTTYSRKSLDEGLCDYLACSYSRNITEYNWEELYNWDGHNEFWEGRMCTTNKDASHYSSNKSIYDNGAIICNAMMELWEKLGRDTADALVFSALYQMSSTLQFKDMAKLIMDADSVLHNGAHQQTICDVFTEKKFFPEGYCITGIEEPRVINNISINEIKFYRNGELSIDLGSIRTANVRLLSSDGKVVLRKKDWQAGSSIQTLDLSPGVYFIRIDFEGGRHVQKLIRGN